MTFSWNENVITDRNKTSSVCYRKNFTKERRLKMKQKKTYVIQDLLEITRILRGENGCPWDRQQTIESLKKYVLEESYEVIDACDAGGMKLADELGDLLLQITMMSQIGTEENSFCFDDVCNLICQKMILRHPHVFGDETADTSEKVLDNWEKIKQKERSFTTVTESMQDITAALPSLLRAYKIQKKAAKVGFDWEDAGGAMAKVKEELAETEEAARMKNPEAITEEIGDLLFAVVNAARFYGVNPELALKAANDKFIHRFAFVEQSAAQQGRDLEKMPLEEMDELWEQAKEQEKKKGSV